MANGSTLRKTTGQMDWSGGVNSDKSPTIVGPGNPNRLNADQLAWLNNATVRGNGLSPRAGARRLLRMPVTALYQGGVMYRTSGFPYIVCMVGGDVYQIRVDSDNSVENVSNAFNLRMPPTEPLAYFQQGEEFLVIQAGDYQTLPLFYWNDGIGVTMRRSLGQQTTLGVTALNFNVPAVGARVLVDLTGPYSGANNQTVLINGKSYTALTSGSSTITIKNELSNGTFGTYPVGFVVPSGTSFYRFGGQFIFNTTAEFTVPAVGATVEVSIDRNLLVMIGTLIGPAPTTADWFSVQSLTIPNPGANQVYLVNINDTPAALIPAGSIIGTNPELPAAGPMDYYMGRLWEANGREYIAGDIVGGPSGSPAFNFRDAILYTSENTFISLGGTFTVPDMAGNIRALKHPVTLDTALGEGQLFVFTNERVYSTNVVPTRADWKALKEPIQRVAQINFGTTSDRSVVGVNGDLFFRAMDGARSMTQAVRYFDQWGNVPISIEETRAIASDNRGLLRFASAILFDNRVLMTCLPQQSDIGVIHKGLMPLNFDTISTLAAKLPPAWEGLYEGIDILQVLVGDFGGLERAFAFVRSQDGFLELWELTLSDIEDFNESGESRINWVIETPAYTWGTPFELKQLDSLELWIDRLRGTVDFQVFFRPDQHPCWEYYFGWQVCAPKNNCEDIGAPVPCPYPTQVYKPQYRATMILPTPPTFCENANARPINHGFQFQFRIFIKGFCRVRGILAHALPRDRAPFERLVCGDQDPASTPIPMKTIGFPNT